MATNNFKPFATGTGANVLSQTEYEALAALAGGFTSGKASSAQINKAIRQATFIAASIAQFILNKSAIDVLDDGDLAGFVTDFGNALNKHSQPLDAGLTSLAALAGGANMLPYYTAADVFAQTSLTAIGRSLIGQSTVVAALSYLGGAPLASPVLTGTPTAPTAAAGTNTTQIATMAALYAATIGFGLGASQLPVVSDLNSPTVTGFYRFGAAATNNPAPSYGTLFHLQYDVNNAMQVVYSSQTNGNRVFNRVYNSEGWSTTRAFAMTDSPALTGTPTAPTAPASTNTTQLATTAFVQAAIAQLVGSSPAALDTLNELAAALGDDPNFSTTMINALALKASLASPTFTGTPAAPTAAAGTNTTQIATTAFLQAAITALSLGTASQRAVGIGANQIPDMNSFGSSLITNGYYKLPGGLIVQWFTATGSTSATVPVNFPIPFPSQLFGTTLAMDWISPGYATLQSQTLSGVSVNTWNSSGTRSALAVTIIAVGK